MLTGFTIEPMNNHHLPPTARPQWIFCTLLFLLASLATKAQPEVQPGQLIALLRESPPDTNQVKLLLELGSHYLYRPQELQPDLDSSLYFLQKARALSEVLRSEKWTEESLWMLSFCYFEREEVQQGREAFSEIIRAVQNKGDKKAEADAWVKVASWMYRSERTYDERIHYFEQARALYLQIGDKKAAIDAYKDIADSHLNQGKLDESEKELLDVIEQYKAIGYRDLHYTYDLLAALNTLKGNMNRALFYGLEMIKSMEATGDSASANTFYYRLARIYNDLGQTEKSIEFFKKAFAKTNESEYSLANYIARGLIKLGKPEEALAFLQNIVRKHPLVNISDKASVASALGDCYYALRQYDLAEKYYIEMIEQESLLKRQNHFTSTVNFAMGKFYVNRHRYREAAPYLQKALDVPAGILTIQRLKDTHLLLFKVDSAGGNYLSAIQHFQRHKMLNDSLFNEAKSRQIEELLMQGLSKQLHGDFELKSTKGLTLTVTFEIIKSGIEPGIPELTV